MANLKPVGVPLDRTFRNDLNENIEALNSDIANVDAKTDGVQEQLNQLVIDGDSSVEAAQARVDEKGQSFPTLKAHLDDKGKKMGALSDFKASGTSIVEKSKNEFTERGINVKWFNASGSAQTFIGSITAGSKNLSVTTSSDFKAGQGIKILGAAQNGWDLITTIESVNGLNITLTVAATTTATARAVYHDDTLAINNAINLLAGVGGEVRFPAGVYLASSPIKPKKLVRLVGSGHLASTIKLQGYANCNLIEFTDSAEDHACLENLILDGNSGFQSAITGATLYVDDITQTVSDEHYLFKDLLILNSKKDGVFVGQQIREARFNNVVVKKADSNCFNLECTDSFFLQCTAVSGKNHGFNITGANIKFVSCKAFYCGDNYTTDSTVGDGFNINGVKSGRHNQFSACESQENARHGFALNGVYGNIIESAISDTNGRVARKLASNYSVVNSHHNTLTGTSAERTGLNGELLSTLHMGDSASTGNSINLRHFVDNPTTTQMLPISGVKPFVDNVVSINNNRYETYDQIALAILDTNNDGVVDGFTSGDTAAGVTKTFSIDYAKQCQVINVTTATTQYTGSYIMKEIPCFPNDLVNVYALVKAENTGTVNINAIFLDGANATISNTQSNNIQSSKKTFDEAFIKDFVAPANTAKVRIRIDVFNNTANGAAKGLIKAFKASVTR